jgi:hypothetical protein
MSFHKPARARRAAGLSATAGVFAIAALFSCLLCAQKPGAQSMYKVLNSGPFVIRSVVFRIEGSTREFVLAAKAGIELGRRFPDRAVMEAFLADRRLFLHNERVLESVKVEYGIEALASGDVAVDVVVTTKDTWNLIALPYLKYDSNEGVSFSAKGRDYNFLGSMRPLEIDVEYLATLDGKSAYTLKGDLSLPFRAFGRLWSWELAQEFVLWPDQANPVSHTVIDISLELPTKLFPLTLEASQELYFHEEKDVDVDAYYLSSGISATAAIPTRLGAGRFGKILYRPSLSFVQNWKLAGTVREDRMGPVLSMSNDIEFGRVDWKDNYRSGLAGEISDRNDFNLYHDSVTVNIDATVQAYLAAGSQAGSRAGLAVRLTGFNVTGALAREDVGSAMRGILDSRMNGFFGLFFNLNLPFTILKAPIHTIIGKNWLDFELQVSPFLDYGLLKETPGSLAKARPWFSGGLEVYVYPAIMRSFIMRASAGFDLGHLGSGRGFGESTADGNSPYELFFGVGLMF